jgi:hypothetical protein
VVLDPLDMPSDEALDIPQVLAFFGVAKRQRHS